MKLIIVIILTAVPGLLSAADKSSGPLETTQNMFDAMKAHDVEKARSLFLPGATLSSVKDDGTTKAVTAEHWLEAFRNSKDHWLERIWEPKVLEEGAVAVVWAPYDFHLNQTFSHCGVDVLDLVKTNAGWKLASVVYTANTKHCKPSPLGPPGK